MTDTDQITIPGDWASPAHIADHPTLSLAEKRSLLASWASDARAVPDHPSLRRLDDGRLVSIDDVLEALKLLDTIEATPRRDGHGIISFRRGHWSRLSRMWRRRRDDDDDDDDPPPAVAAMRPRSPTLSGGLAEAA